MIKDQLSTIAYMYWKTKLHGAARNNLLYEEIVQAEFKLMT